MKGDKFSDLGKDIEIFQVVPGDLAGQNSGAFGRRLVKVNDD
jgi:hypothetical protein